MAQNPTQLLAEAMADVSVVLLVSAALTPLFRRLRQPQVIAEIITGIALGPSLLGLLPGNLPHRLFPRPYDRTWQPSPRWASCCSCSSSAGR